jgi:hypothetical protein
MYDIEVIGDQSFAVISRESPAHEFLKAMNTKLVVKKLASEPGEEVWLTKEEVSRLLRGSRISDLQRLVDVGLLQVEHDVTWKAGMWQRQSVHYYGFTDFGLHVMARIRGDEEDVMIPL